MKLFKIVFLSLLAAFMMFGCLPDSKLKIGFNMVPEVLGDGWGISTPLSEDFNETALTSAYELFFSENDYITGISLLVVRNGKLVSEGYCRDKGDRDIKRNLQSATKSFTSLAFGIARDMGYFSDLNQTLYDIMPEAFDSNLNKRDITLRHLMTMRSGLSFNNEDFAAELHIGEKKNQMKYILSKSLYANPGEEYWYRDCDPQLLGGAIMSVSNMTLEEIVDAELFGPMGITDYYWEKNADGHNWAAQAIYMRPRDMAKIGQLVLDNGTWGGDQLVPVDWIYESTSFQTEFAVPGLDLSSVILPDYGYYWWIYESDYTRLPAVRAISAVGSGGQYIFIVPEKNLVIVMTSEPYVEGQFSLERDFFSLASMIINSAED